MLLGMLLASCVSTEGDVNFERMSEEELATYNATQPIRQMIVCADEDRSLSRVRRRRCMTVEQAYGSARCAEYHSGLQRITTIRVKPSQLPWLYAEFGALLKKFSGQLFIEHTAQQK